MLPLSILLAALGCTAGSTDTGYSREAYAEAQAAATCDLYFGCDLANTEIDCNPTVDLCYDSYDDCVERLAAYNAESLADPDRCYSYSPTNAAACVAGIQALSCETWESSWPASCSGICR